MKNPRGALDNNIAFNFIIGQFNLNFKINYFTAIIPSVFRFEHKEDICYIWCVPLLNKSNDKLLETVLLFCLWYIFYDTLKKYFFYIIHI